LGAPPIMDSAYPTPKPPALISDIKFSMNRRNAQGKKLFHRTKQNSLETFVFFDMQKKDSPPEGFQIGPYFTITGYSITCMITQYKGKIKFFLPGGKQNRKNHKAQIV